MKFASDSFWHDIVAFCATLVADKFRLTR